MPAFTILVKVEIFAPLNQVVHFVVEVIIINLLELLIIEWIVIERLKLLLKSCRLDSSLIHRIALLCNQLSILCVSVQLAEPFNLAISALLRCLLLPQLRLKMESFCLF